MPPKAQEDDRVPEPKGLKYTVLADEHARQILEERLGQVEREHYNHALNLRIVEADPLLGEKEIETSKRAMSQLEAAHATLSAELKKLS